MNQKALSIKLRLRPEHVVCIHHKIINQKPYFRNFISVMKYYLDRTETERTLVSNKKVDIQSSGITIELFLLSTKHTNKSSDIRINDRLLVYVLCEGLITGLKIYPEDSMVAK